MILGNFMLLCEFDPDEVYIWFMELFIDSYDWVMVPNVYGMSQFWDIVWDGLFWRFMDKQRDFFIKNPRLRMLVNTFDKMSSEKKENHIINAEKFLEKIDNEK